RPWYLGDYGSDLRDTALMVSLAHRHGLSKPGYDARVFDLARDLTQRRREGDDDARRYGGRTLYLSTQEQIAVGRLGKTLIDDGDKVVSGTLAVGGAAAEISPERLWSRAFGGAEIASGVRFSPQ